VQIVHEEDGQDGEEELIEEEENVDAKYKKYKEDPNAEAEVIAEENIKDIKQSTLRRILKQKEEAIRCKMEELNIANEMLNWGAVKGRMNSEAHTKSERRQLMNRFTQM
jgi:CRISPR/Cas system CMR subunit Cmr6 (Cas7 group RAMP superfamily)